MPITTASPWNPTLSTQGRVAPQRGEGSVPQDNGKGYLGEEEEELKQKNEPTSTA